VPRGCLLFGPVVKLNLAYWISDLQHIMDKNAEVYINLANQVTASLSQNTNETIRMRARNQVLSYLLSAMNGTSTYICQYDAVERSAIVVAEYFARRANVQEFESDLGTVYSAEELGRMLHWIDSNPEQPRILQLDELAEDDPEREELVAFDGKTVLYVPLYQQQQFWGWAEVWESRAKRIFEDVELSYALQLSKALSQLL